MAVRSWKSRRPPVSLERGDLCGYDNADLDYLADQLVVLAQSTGLKPVRVQALLLALDIEMTLMRRSGPQLAHRWRHGGGGTGGLP